MSRSTRYTVRCLHIISELWRLMVSVALLLVGGALLVAGVKRVFEALGLL